MKRFALTATLAALSLAATVPQAGAAVTLGQVAPAPSTECSGTSIDVLQLSVTSGNSYVIPGSGAITSWSTNAVSVAGQMWTMKVFRKVTDPATYMVVGHDGPRPLAAGTLNTFPASIAVKPGDVLGLNDNDGSAVLTACAFGSFPEDSYAFRGDSLPDGASGAFGPRYGLRVNISAVFVPSNSFTLGAITRNKKKGTATLTVSVPNPGELTGSGNGVKVASAATISKSVTAGVAKLTIKAKGKKKTTLNDTGKVKVKPKIAYTPTGGDPSSQSVKVKLKKKL